MDPPTDHDLGRFPLKFNAGCRARLDRTPVRTVRAFMTPPAVDRDETPATFIRDAPRKAT